MMTKRYMQSAWELEIMERLDAATPGPWHIEADVQIAGGKNQEKDWIYVKPEPEVKEERFLFAVCNVGRSDDKSVQADAALIANAPIDLRMLLNLVDRLRTELAGVDDAPGAR